MHDDGVRVLANRADDPDNEAIVTRKPRVERCDATHTHTATIDNAHECATCNMSLQLDVTGKEDRDDEQRKRQTATKEPKAQQLTGQSLWAGVGPGQEPQHVRYRRRARA